MGKYVALKDGTRIFVEIIIDGEKRDNVDLTRPALLFLPGGPGNVDHTFYAWFWKKFSVASEVQPLQVIMMDHRGTGYSFSASLGAEVSYGDPKSWNLEQWGADVCEVCDALTLKEIILAGVSFGGVVAMSAAIRRPNFFKGMILSDTDAHFDLERVLALFKKKAGERGADVSQVCEVARRTLTAPSAENFREYLAVCTPLYGKRTYIPETVLVCKTNEACTLTYNREELFTFDFRQRLPKLEFPVLVMTGDQSPVHNFESALETFMSLPKGYRYLRRFCGAGSPVYLDCEGLVLGEACVFINFCLGKGPAPQETADIKGCSEGAKPLTLGMGR